YPRVTTPVWGLGIALADESPASPPASAGRRRGAVRVAPTDAVPERAAVRLDDVKILFPMKPCGAAPGRMAEGPGVGGDACWHSHFRGRDPNGRGWARCGSTTPPGNSWATAPTPPAG